MVHRPIGRCFREASRAAWGFSPAGLRTNRRLVGIEVAAHRRGHRRRDGPSVRARRKRGTGRLHRARNTPRRCVDSWETAGHSATILLGSEPRSSAHPESPSADPEQVFMTQDTRKDPRAKVLSMTVRYKSATLDEF